MIGLSLSLCVKDIMAGKVSEWDVTKIVTNTCCRTEGDWQKLYDAYRQVYWQPFEGAAVAALLARLRALGKIEQPRLNDPDHSHSIGSGVWVDACTGV